MIYWMAIALVAVALILMGVLIGEVMKSKQKPQPMKPMKPMKPYRSTSARQVSPRYESRLVQMVNGDRDAALRLVGALRTKFPFKREDWYWEKAIHDLERDRS